MYEIVVDLPEECRESFAGDVRAGYVRRYPGSKPDMERGPGGNVVFREQPDRVDALLRIISASLETFERRTGSPDCFRIFQRNLDFPEQRKVDGASEAFAPIPEVEIHHPSSGCNGDPAHGRILLDSGWAFGSGRHPTTILCLRLLREALREWTCRGERPCRVLDLGCGSGVLALAAVVLGADGATGVDINPRAVETARRNARLNGLEGRITLIESSWERVRGCWDLVLANLTPCPSDELSERLCGWIRPEGLAILSGFGREQGRELEASCVSRGLRPQRMSHQEDWAALVVSALRPEGRSGESAGENRFPSQR